MSRIWNAFVSWGPIGVFLVAMIESMGIPNPGGTDWLLVGMAIARPNDAALCAALAVCGSLAGTMVFFEVLRKGGEKLLAKYTSSGRGQRFRAWFLRYGLLTVFIPALVPIPVLPMKAFVACAGAMRVNRARFLAVMAIGRSFRYAGLAYLGVHLGSLTNSKAWVKSHFWGMLGFSVLLFAVLYGMIWLADRKRVESNRNTVESN